jgi:UDP-N-acetyl-D-glucosamine dehydrogenase
MVAITALPVSHSELLDKIESRTARIGIIGLGYVGLPLSLLFNEQRFAITGFDVDPKKVKTLSEGGSYIYRIPATDIQVASSRGFRATCDYSQIERMDAVIICVPTPLNDHHEPDMSYIVSTVESIARICGLAS